MERYILTANAKKAYTSLFSIICSAFFLIPSIASACACGCGMFSVGMPGLGLATKTGVSINLQTTFLDQNAARQGNSKIPLNRSPDQRINSIFYNLNTQIQFNRKWGMVAMIPFWQRSFTTNGNFGNGPAQMISSNVNTLSDIRIMGEYTGFSPDMSIGLLFGLKLPTGTYTAPGFDRDTQPGSGTTDLLLGGYKMGQELNWGWFVQGVVRSAISSRDGYRPGDSLQLVLGTHYDALPYGHFHVTPMLRVNATLRQADSGIYSSPSNTGLQTVYLTPGILISMGAHWRMNANVYLPVYDHVHGVQLVPHQIVSVGITYSL